MKALRLFLIVALTSMLFACSSSASYDQQACEQLKEKIMNNESFSQEDYTNMLNQFVAASDELYSRTKSLSDDPEERGKQVMQNPELVELTGYVIGFAFYLEQHQNDLDDKNHKLYEEAVKHLESLK